MIYECPCCCKGFENDINSYFFHMQNEHKDIMDFLLCKKDLGTDLRVMKEHQKRDHKHSGSNRLSVVEGDDCSDLFSETDYGSDDC
jgi:hypothetical protein